MKNFYEYLCEIGFDCLKDSLPQRVTMEDKEEDLTKYGLYDENWHWFEEELITNPLNTKIKDFDMIIVCEDGCIRIYKNEVEE